MAGNKIGLIYKVGRFDGLFTEAEMRNGNAARFFGVVREIALSIKIGVVTDYLYGVLVGADRSVGAESPELAGGRAGRGGVADILDLKRKLGNIILNTDGETLLRILCVGVPENCGYLSRSGILGTETVATGVYRNILESGISKSGHNIEIKRLADASGLLGAVKHRNALNRLGKRSDKVLNRERTVKVNLYKTDLFAGGVEMINRLLNGLAYRTHCDYDRLGVLCAVVVEKLIFGADFLVNGIHVILNNTDYVLIVLVGGFLRLEEYIGILGGTALNRMLRIERTAAELVYGVPIEHIGEIRIIPAGNLLNFVRGTETVKEMQERNPSLYCRKMGYGAEVHYLLRGVGAQHCIAGLSTCIYIGMIAEDRQRMGRKRTGRNMNNAREQLAGHFVHVRDHKKQSL